MEGTGEESGDRHVRAMRLRSFSWLGSQVGLWFGGYGFGVQGL